MKKKRLLIKDFWINLFGYLVTISYFVLAGLVARSIFWPNYPHSPFILILKIFLFIILSFFCIFFCFLFLKTNFFCKKK